MKEMNDSEWMEWKERNRTEIETNHPDWNTHQVSTYLNNLADIFEGQGLILRPRSVRTCTRY